MRTPFLVLLSLCWINSACTAGLESQKRLPPGEFGVLATVTAASCNQPDVQAALSSAKAGDTIVIPAGTCTWSTPLYFDSPANFTLAGAGGQSTLGSGDATVIIDDINRSGYDAGLINVNTNASGSFRMTGITFRSSRNSYARTYGGSIRVGGSTRQLRMDHLHLDNLDLTAIAITGQIYGVIDHSIFDLAAVAGTGVRFYAGNWGGHANGDGAWAEPTLLGSDRFVFVEDNVFNGYGVVNDSYQGSRWVIRYNQLNVVGLQTHPTGGSNRARGTRAWEIYKNITNSPNTQAQFNFFFLSSGTGVIWGNHAPTGYNNFVTVHSMRKNNSTYQQTPAPGGWGYCGTEFNGTGSNWDQNLNASTGYACIDQPGRGMGDLLSGEFPNAINLTTGCTASAPCAWPRQALEPIYEWMNSWSTASGGNFWSVYETSVIAQNRDYYLHTSQFTGATGTGSGLLSARPQICTTGVGYWGTDTNTLYKCTSTNTWSASYTPYPYPHPLTIGSPQPTPASTPEPTPGATFAPTPAPTPSTYTCPGGLLCDGNPVTGSAGQQVCGADFKLYTCASSGWRSDAISCTCGSPPPSPSPTATPTSSSDLVAPSVTITSPADGAVVPRNTFLTVTADATDNVGVTLVEFYLNGNLKCSDATAVYSCLLKIPGKTGRTHTIEVKAYDGVGNVGRSSVIVQVR